MQSRELTRQLQKLESLLARSEAAAGAQMDLRAHWGRYLCVLTAGFVENAFAEVYSQYAKSSASPSVAGFTEAVLFRVRNPKASKFIETAEAFNPAWKDGLEAFLADSGRKDALDGVMANRHLIAHGQDSGVTAGRVKEYLARCVEVVDYIEKQCGLTAPY